jgi:hypothetical protein
MLLPRRSGEADDLITVFADEHLHEAARLRYGFRAEDLGRRQLGDPIFNAVAARFDFVLTDARQLGIGEHAEGDVSLSHLLTSQDIYRRREI